MADLETRTTPLRAAAICGLVTPVSFVAGVVLADVVQPAAFSPVNDDISDLGALTATRVDLEQTGLSQTDGATHVEYRVIG